ncbi:MAG: M16 family metallopeptidase [Clostridium sp.]|uniref:M16 family metallopeptidase n=1 Tax=Clostridium chrysemydis TaxID=2665504 RepID=UPI003EE5B944
MQKTFVLNNGLKIISEKVDGVNSISVGVMIKNGSRNETEDISGISHFIEHMLFKGTKKRSAKDIVSQIENVGGQLNAFTGKEITCYYIKSLSTHLELDLDILSDMILNSEFNDEEIEKEKNVVIEEINMNEDMPEDVLENIHAKSCFGDSSLSRPILGNINSIKNLTRDKILDFISEKYAPQNSVISICGNFDEEKIVSLIEKYFKNWKSKEFKEDIFLDTKIQSNSLYKSKEIEQLHINLGLNGLPFGDERGYALILLNNIFGGGASSILFQKVREELGLCYTIYSYAQPYVNIGSLNIYIGLSKEQASKALEVIKRELDTFVKFGITDEEFEINKEKIKANYILGLESTSSKMFANCRSMLFRGRVRTQEEVIEKIDNITKEDIDFVLKNCFGKGIINTSYVGPNVSADELDSIVFDSTDGFPKSRNIDKFDI